MLILINNWLGALLKQHQLKNKNKGAANGYRKYDISIWNNNLMSKVVNFNITLYNMKKVL